MTTPAVWLLATGALLVAQPGPPDKAKKDLDRLQGKWVMAGLEVDGKDVIAEKLQGTTLTVKGNKYEVKVKDMALGCAIRLDPSKEPREIDMIFSEPGGAEKVHKGIYVIESDTLKICRGLNADQARPGQFATWPGTNYFVVTWKRAP
jgi:uncharacterized protein (TIGR03067 family)